MALCLLGFALDLLYVEHISLAKDLRTQQDRSRAVFLAQEWLELSAPEIPEAGPASWSTVLPPRAGMECTLDVHPHPQYDYMREVVVTVRWRGIEGGPQHEVRMGRLLPDRIPAGSR